MFYTVYKITNKINGKVYYGAHETDDLDDDYPGSGGKNFQNDLDKYGKENFEREILFFLDSSDDMFDKERKVIAEENGVADPNCYNEKPGGKGGWGHIHADPEKNSKRCKERWQDKEYREKQYKARCKAWEDPEIRERRTHAIKDGWQNKKSKKKASEKAKRLWEDEKYRKRILQSRKKSSLKGRKYITDGTDNKMIPPDDPIPEGWRRGRTTLRNCYSLQSS